MLMGTPCNGPRAWSLITAASDSARLLADPLGIDVHEGIQLRIQPLDFREMRFGEFYRRNFSPANLTAHLDGG